MRRVFLCAAMFAIVSCQRQAIQNKPPAQRRTAAQPQNLGQAKINAVLPMNAAQGFVESHLNADKFKRGEPVVVTVTLRDPPKGIVLRTQWLDSKGKQLAAERKELAGQNTATFEWKGKPLKPGNYRVVTFWGENVAGDHKFTIAK